jgi:5-methylcytosine-specific restriction enzyme subunit McrC
MGHTVPVQNLYYLLLYAWNRIPEGRTIEVTGIPSPELPNLLAKVLLDGVRNLLRRGFHRNYVQADEDLTRPRGRLLVSKTITRNVLSRVQVACTTDDLSRDVLHNQIIKTTLERLAKTAEVDAQLRNAIAAILSGLSDVRSISLTVRDFGRVQLHGNNMSYGFLLRVCALAYEALLPEPGTGRFRFRDVLADPQTMGLIFQDFVRNFFRLEQTQFAVKGDQIHWCVVSNIGYGHRLLPVMYTDTSLFDGTRTIIVECKWTPTTLQAGRGIKTLRSDHLYQLHAYMTQHAGLGIQDQHRDAASGDAEGQGNE